MWRSFSSISQKTSLCRTERHIYCSATLNLKCARAHFKFNPFAPDVPVEALQMTPRIESFCWRVEQLVGEGGFAAVHGASGVGKSVTLRVLAERLFGVELHPHNRHGGAKVLRARWQGHIDASLCRPVLIADEAPRIASAKMLPVGVVASADMLPAIAPATIASPLPRRGYGHQDDTLGAGRTHQRSPATLQRHKRRGEAQDPR